MNHLTYVPASAGGWTVLAHAPRLLVLTTAPTPELALDALAALADDSGFRATLDILTRSGLSAAPDFLLVEVLEDSTRIIVRGDLPVRYRDGSGDHELSGAEVSTWSERSVAGLDTLSVAVPAAEAASTPLTLTVGAAYVSWISLAAVSSGVPAAEPAGVPAAEPAGVPAASAADAPGARARTAAVAVPAAERPQAAVPDTRAVSTVSEATVTELAPPAATDDDSGARDRNAAATSETSVAGYDYLFGDTVFHSVADAAVRAEDDEEDEAEDAATGSGGASAPGGQADSRDGASARQAAGDHDGHTVMTSDVAALRAGRANRTPARATPTHDNPHFVLEFATGARESVRQPVILGRAPSATKISGGRIPRLITVGGADQDISRSHAQFVVEGDTVVVTDLHSRNGTLVTLPGRGTRKLRAGEPTAVILGTLVDFGGGITLTIGRE